MITILCMTHYQPWLLGWCRWRVVVSHHESEEAHGIQTTLAEGKWLWRGLRAPFEEWSQFGTDGYEVYGSRSRKLADIR
jgi:hypothetical protein